MNMKREFEHEKRQDETINIVCFSFRVKRIMKVVGNFMGLSKEFEIFR